MAATPPPGYTPPPADLPQRGDRATFSDRVDAWVTWFSTVILTQLAAIVANAYANALDAAASALAASGFSDTAVTARDAAIAARDAAQGYRDDAAAFATDADNSADAAEASAIAAASSAQSLIATSTSSVAIGLGAKVFTIPAGKQFVANEVVSMNASSTARMFGTVTSLAGTTLTIDSTKFEGSGTFTNWTIAPAGAEGAAGGITGGNLTGALNWLRGSDVASAATPDPWAAGGNYEVLTGTATVTGFAAAPQAGANRRVLVSGTPTLTAGADLIIKGVQSGQSTTLAPGDEFEVYAETTTRFRVTIIKGDGSGIAGLGGSFMNSRYWESTDVFIAPRTGWYRITCIGAAGRGAIATSITAAALGGGSGGIAIGMRFLIGGQSYAVAPGLPAAAATAGANPSTTPGVAGGSSTFSGSGITTLTGGGGQGGTASITAGSPPVAPAGGVATGGDINIPGASPGTISAVITSNRAATGGAGAGLTGVAYSSGSITATGTPTGFNAATGGAAVGGKSADIAVSTNVNVVTGGAGSRTASTGVPGGQNFAGVSEATPGNVGSSVATYDSGLQVLLNATGGGSPGNTAGNSGIAPSGAASGGAASSSAAAQSGAAGNLGATGGVATVSTAVGTQASAAGIGSGSGGVASPSTTATVQPGGKGQVRIDW